MGKISGMLFFLAGFVILMGITTAEIFFPGYSVSKDFISNLGSSRPPVIVIRQPSAIIFDTTMIITGLAVVAGGLLLKVSEKDKLLKAAIVITGVGSAGVGLFPAYHGMLHDIIAFTTFASGGIVAMLSARILSAPFNYLAGALGATTLTFLAFGVFFPSVIVPVLGIGGTERWVAFPNIIWLIGFGGYLMGAKKPLTNDH